MQGYKNVERVKPSGLELVDRLVGVQRVTKVTKGGRAFGFSAIAFPTAEAASVLEIAFISLSLDETLVIVTPFTSSTN